MKIIDSLVHAQGQISARDIVDAGLEAEVLVRHVLGMQRSDLFAALEEPMAPAHGAGICRLVERRLRGEPLAYIVGHKEFYALSFLVNPSVLIPRQETELLVEKVLDICAARPPRPTIADVGTGCGAIAIAIACNRPDAIVYATDISRQALAIADLNRHRHAVEHRVLLWQADLLESLREPVDVLVSNLPYLKTGEIAGLPEDVKREPHRALDGGIDGLDLIGRLMQQAERYVRPEGCILVEIDPAQLESVSQMARDAIPGARVSFALDLLGLPRVVVVERHPDP